MFIVFYFVWSELIVVRVYPLGTPSFFGNPKNIFGNLEFNFGNLLKIMSIIAII